jgi:hypothetical protein
VFFDILCCEIFERTEADNRHCDSPVSELLEE